MGRTHQKAVFQLVLIRPTHYDDDGYPITWLKSLMPSNTLAALYGLGEASRRHRVLGPDVEIVIKPMDEANSRIHPPAIAADFRRLGGKGLICLVGVQSNQFPRALDIARQLRSAGLPVALGGFHVAGCLSMLPVIPSEIQEAMDLGISIYAGEPEEGRLDDLLRDAWHGRLKSLYNYLDDLPDLENAPVPYLPPAALRRNQGRKSSVDLGRGCPFQCSFCTIINVQGRKSRFRTPDDLEAIIRQNHAQGISRFFITDDNLARNRRWEEFFDRIVELRENEAIAVSLIIQVDTLCHRIPRFIEKARRAGVFRCFIGLENINPDNLLAAKKRQNRITEYRTMLQAWHAAGISTMAGYIVGFPADTRESILRDIEIVKKELPLDILELFMLTPLPGSEDHQTLWQQGAWMDADLNKYDTHHRVVHHPKMSDAEFDRAYRDAWRAYYTPEHIETVARRNASVKGRRIAIEPAYFMTLFKMILEAEGVHPLEGGIVRMKYRRDRRHGMPIEPFGVFHWKLARETVRKLAIYGRLTWQVCRIARRVTKDPKRHEYTDLALTPVDDGDIERLALFHDTAGGEAAAARHRDEERARARHSAARTERLEEAK